MTSVNCGLHARYPRATCARRGHLLAFFPTNAEPDTTSDMLSENAYRHT
jgi:hypothetical protein